MSIYTRTAPREYACLPEVRRTRCRPSLGEPRPPPVGADPPQPPLWGDGRDRSGPAGSPRLDANARLAIWPVSERLRPGPPAATGWQLQLSRLATRSAICGARPVNDSPLNFEIQVAFIQKQCFKFKCRHFAGTWKPSKRRKMLPQARGPIWGRTGSD